MPPTRRTLPWRFYKPSGLRQRPCRRARRPARPSPADPDTVWPFLQDVNAIRSTSTRSPRARSCRASPPTGSGPSASWSSQTARWCGERLVALDDVEGSDTSHLLEGPFPFTAYYSTIRASPVSSDGTSLIEWWSTYDCEAADAQAMDDLLAGTLYRGGLERLRSRFA